MKGTVQTEGRLTSTTEEKYPLDICFLFRFSLTVSETALLRNQRPVVDLAFRPLCHGPEPTDRHAHYGPSPSRSVSHVASVREREFVEGPITLGVLLHRLRLYTVGREVCEPRLMVIQ